MKHPLNRRTGTRRAWLFALLAPLVLASCVWPMDPVPTWDLRFQGTVTRSADAAPVAGAQVEVWLELPEEASGERPFAIGQTNASGQFVVRKELRSRIPPPWATLRVTPRAESRAEPRTIGGEVDRVFSSVARSGRGVTFKSAIVLDSTPFS